MEFHQSARSDSSRKLSWLLEQVEGVIRGASCPPPIRTTSSDSPIIARPTLSSDQEAPGTIIEFRRWTKTDWKQLDSCFTDERMDVGARQNRDYVQLADVDEVDLDDVIDRYVSGLGGLDVTESFGPEWHR